MIHEYKIPSPGESISEVQLAAWLVDDGAYVEKNDEVAEVESDKATLMLNADQSGKISFKVGAGETVAVGIVVFTIDDSAEKPAGLSIDTKEPLQPALEKVESKVEIKPIESKVKITPVAEEVMRENNLNIEDVLNGLRRISKQDVQSVIENTVKAEQVNAEPKAFSREEERSTMTMLRKRISERLVNVKNETAMLTTFNEIDMSAVMELRKNMQAAYIEKFGSKLGFMGFFTKAVGIAAKFFPAVNSQIDGDEIVIPKFVDVGIAVQTSKGLMVPIVRNVESKAIPQIEQDIKELAEKARSKKISMAEMSGGTISITNGGVFGSLLSTPIINPPQSAILGMHNIVERPIAKNGQIVICPMMYVALSYDHRIIDGKYSVGFLLKVKELIEKPELMVFDGEAPGKRLLEL